MAYDPTTDFYVTKGAGAATLNGGGPRKDTANALGGGVDGPIYALTGGGGAGATVGAGTPTVILDLSGNDWANGTFTVAVDDWLVFDTGGNKERRRVTSIADIGNGNITVHAACTPAIDVSVNVGGAVPLVEDTGAGPANWLTNAFVNASSDPPRLYIGPGTYAEDVTWDNAGTTTIPITLEGYNSTPGDGPSEGTYGTIPEIEGVAASGQTGALVIPSGKDYMSIRALKITAQTNVVDAVTCSGDYVNFEHCYLQATGTGNAQGVNAGSGHNVCVSKCYIEGEQYGAYFGNNSAIIDSYVVYGGGTSTNGIRAGNYCAIINCIIKYDGTDTTGVALMQLDGVSNWVHSCTMDGNANKATSGIMVSGPKGGFVGNCLISNINGYGLDADAVTWISHSYNAYFDCTSGNIDEANFMSDNPVGNVTVTADPYETVGTDWRLNNNSPGGAQCKGTGFPGQL